MIALAVLDRAAAPPRLSHRLLPLFILGLKQGTHPSTASAAT